MLRLIPALVAATLALGSGAVAQQQRLPEHLREGSALLRQQKYAEAIDAFEEVVREDPEDGEAWYQLGLAYHFAQNYDQAIRCHFLSLQFIGNGHPFKVNATYNAACVYALQGKSERSLQWLHRARNLGFSNFTLVGTDTDLTSLRKDPRFAAFRATGTIQSPSDDSAAVMSLTPVMPGGTGGVESGPDGLLYVANFGSDVWTVEPDGTWAVLATGFNKAADCTLDDEGNLLQVDHGASKVWAIAPDGTKTDLGVKGLNGPVGIDTDESGGFFVTNFRDHSILHVGTDGSTRVVARRGLLNGPNGLVNAGEAGLFVVNYNDGCVLRLDPKSGEARFLCELPGGGNGHVVWNGEALYVTARAGHRVFRVTTVGEISLVAGTGAKGTADGGAASAVLSLPNGIALSDDGASLFVNDHLPGNRSIVRRIDMK